MIKSKQKIFKKEFKILIVIPKLILTQNINYNYMIPLGLLYISSVMKKAGYNVASVNLNHRKGSVSEIIKQELDKKKYDVFCTGLVGGPNYVMVDEIIKNVKKHPSNPKTIIGGSLITSEPELIFESLGVDFGVLGEGEITINELLKSIMNKQDFKKVKGIIYKDKNAKIIITPNREPIKNIETISYPDFEGFEFEKYLKNLYCNQQAYNTSYDFPIPYPVLSSRSCPFQCTFCYHSIGYKYRERSIDDVIKEIKEAVKKYKINVIALYDDMFSFKKERVYEFCEKIKELNQQLPQKLKWSCQLSVVKIDEEMLRTMKDAGCELISYGFESFSQKVLNSMKKPITPKQIDFAIKATQKAKIGIQGNFIFGDVAETKETARETLNYWKKNCRGQLILGFIQPFSGSAIYKHCLKKGIIKDKLKFIKSALEGKHIINMTDSMTNQELHELFNEVMNLRNKYFPYITPVSVKKSQKRGHMVKVKCPFCKEKTEYNNYYLQKRFLYKSWNYCRKCRMRFIILSPLMNLSRRLPALSSFAEKNIKKIRNKIMLNSLK